MESLDKLIEQAEKQALKKGRRKDPRLKKKAGSQERMQKPRPVEQAESDEALVNRALTTVPAANRAGPGFGSRSQLEADERARKFAREYFVSGFDWERAFLAAGWRPIRSNLSRVLDKPVVRDELEKLSAIARQKIEAEGFDCTGAWLELAVSNITEFLEQDENGTIRVGNIMSMDPAKQRQIRKVKVDRRIVTKDDVTEEYVNTEIELFDKIKPLDALSRIQGIYQDKVGDAVKDFLGTLVQRLTHMGEQTGRTIEHQGK